MIYYCYKNITEVSSKQCEKMKQEISFHFSEKAALKRKDSICAKALLCEMIEKLYGLTDYHITADENGKLFIADSNVFFNISHSDDMIFCVVGTENVGCDVQLMTKCNMKVAERFFTKNEKDKLVSDENKDELFFKFWTVKESILKWRGDGISGGLSTYDFSDCANDDSFNCYGLNFITFTKDKYAFSVCILIFSFI